MTRGPTPEARLVFVTRRSLAMYPDIVYHLSLGYSNRTGCGRAVWGPPSEELLVPMRRDIADRIGRICRYCA